jgi:GMP synthase-like glutamine amidotransferase
VLLTTRSSGATNQCFRIGDSKTYGFQYHIEVRHAHERETENARVLQQSGCSVSSRAWQPVLSMMLSCLPSWLRAHGALQPTAN